MGEADKMTAGIEGTEKPAWKDAEISTSGISPTLFFFKNPSMQRMHQQGGVERPVTHLHSTGAPLHANFFMVMSTPGGPFGSLPWLRLLRTCLKAIKWITDSLSTVLCGHRCHVVYTTFLLCQPQNKFQGRRVLCVILGLWACVLVCWCVCAKPKEPALKAWLIQFYTFPGVSKQIGHRVDRQTSASWPWRGVILQYTAVL